VFVAAAGHEVADRLSRLPVQQLGPGRDVQHGERKLIHLSWSREHHLVTRTPLPPTKCLNYIYVTKLQFDCNYLMVYVSVYQLVRSQFYSNEQALLAYEYSNNVF